MGKGLTKRQGAKEGPGGSPKAEKKKTLSKSNQRNKKPKETISASSRAARLVEHIPSYSEAHPTSLSPPINL